MGSTPGKRKGLLESLFELLGEEEEDGTTRPARSDPAPPAAPDLPEAAVYIPVPQAHDAEAPVAAAPSSELDVQQALQEQIDAGSSRPPADEPHFAAPVRAPVATVAGPDTGSLGSPEPAERLAGLQAMAGAELGGAYPAVVDRLLHDPEADVRLEALDLVSSQPGPGFDEVLRRVLRDPSDVVRARAVSVVALETTAAIPELVRVLGLQRWPLTQRTALEALPAVIASSGLDELQFSDLLERVAQLDSSVLMAQRPGFSALAAACGRERLMQALTLRDLRRLGAARLLVEESSTVALRAVATLTSDDLEEVRVTAALARSILQTATEDRLAPPPAPYARQAPGAQAIAPEPAPSAHTEEPLPQRPIGGEARSELVAGLARALQDPDESVRSRAREALVRAWPDSVVGWVRTQLRSADLTGAETAAIVVESLGLKSVAADLLEHAAGLRAEQRGTLTSALDALALEPAELAELTKSVEASRRHEAIRLVGDIGGSAVVPYLRPFLNDSSGPVRLATLELLGRVPDASFLDVASAILKRDSSPAVRATAVKLLSSVADVAGGLRVLEDALEDSDPDVRSTAIETMSPEMASAASMLLVRAAGDQDDSVRLAAVRRLTDSRQDKQALWTALLRCSERQREEVLTILEDRAGEELGALATSHLDSMNPADRALAVALAARVGTPEAIRQTIAALRDPETAVRTTAAHGLSQLRTPEAIPALAHALKDPYAEVRIEAVRALGVIDDDDVIDVLIGSLKDPEPRVRDQAATVLQRWRSPAVARRLVESLRSSDFSRTASDLLVRMGEAALDPLLEQLATGDEETLPVIGDLLSSIVGADPFMDDLGSLEPGVRTRAVEALGAIGGSRAVDGLVYALADPDDAIRRRALEHIGRIGDMRAYDAVRRTFANDPVLEVVAAAEEALRALTPPGEEGGL